MKDSGRSFRSDWKSQNLTRELKESAIRSVDIRTALERYGLSFNMQGAALCPFHKEKTASFRVRGRFWHCFGCNESGELVKFVRKMFDLSYDDALETICRDFGLNSAKPTIADLERLDRFKIERYNKRRRYIKLLSDVDWYTEMYWLAYDVLTLIVQFYGGESIENELYVSAHFALMNAQKALEQAEYECSKYIRENPETVLRVKQNATGTNKRFLPPAPKWG